MERYLVQLTAPTGNTAESTAFAQRPQLAGTKRKSTDASDLPTIDLDDYDIPDGQAMDSCTVVRDKINRFLDAGEMKVGQFCDAIGVSGNAYRRFMAQNGEFANAWLFFKKREMAGLKIPTKKQKTAAANAGTAKAGTASSASSGKKDAVTDISFIHLDGEENDSVEVYDSCDEIRKKIAAHLRKPGVTAAQFCRDLLAQYHGEKKPSQIQSGQLTKFRGYKGADTGNTSCVFYAAYVFFEKMRLAEGKPKSKHRQEMERIWAGEGGFDVTRGHHRGYGAFSFPHLHSAEFWVSNANCECDRYLCLAGDNPVQDQFGRVHMMRGG
ncbi:hypothetical protein E4T43_02599 [Aureobasidium subglaciale]|nr:hypothetical protein E4T43_02599 [Aureobasidium subglaciale]